MLSPKKRDEVKATIAKFLKTPEADKLTCQQAYEKLYPDQVDAGTFESAYQHARNPALEAAHKKLLDTLAPAPSP